jgi:hypothetical protein
LLDLNIAHIQLFLFDRMAFTLLNTLYNDEAALFRNGVERIDQKTMVHAVCLKRVSFPVLCLFILLLAPHNEKSARIFFERFYSYISVK